MSEDCCGGSKDLGTFNLYFSSDNLPPYSSLTYEGSYYQYYFETGIEEEKVFSATYTTAVSRDPVSSELEYYLCVGLNSKYSGKGLVKFGRKLLNLVILLDISGSMGSNYSIESKKCKLNVAKESIVSILDFLRPDDRIGIVLFDDKHQVLQELKLWKDVDRNELKKKIMEVRTHGGTSMTEGMKGAMSLYATLKDVRSTQYINRIINLTDAEFNVGDTDTKSLIKLMEDAANKKVYKTFVGMGIDFNTELVEAITKVKGSSFLSPASAKEFHETMTTEFDYLLAPIALDIAIEVNTDLFKIERVFGSPGNEIPNDNKIRMSCIFPSPREDPRFSKGGAVLVKLAPKDVSRIKTLKEVSLDLSLSYMDMDDNKHNDKSVAKIELPENGEYYSGTAVRKAIVITKFVSLLKHWIKDTVSKVKTSTINSTTGITPPPLEFKEDKYSRVSKTVSKEYKKMFSSFTKYVNDHIEKIDDESVLKNVDEYLSALCNYVSPQSISDAVKEELGQADMIKNDDQYSLDRVSKNVAKLLECNVDSALTDVVKTTIGSLVFDDATNNRDEEFFNINKNVVVQSDIDQELIRNYLKGIYGSNIQTNYLNDVLPQIKVRYLNYCKYKLVYNLLKEKITGDVDFETKEKVVSEKLGNIIDSEVKKFVQEFHPSSSFDSIINVWSYQSW
eukprot:TRINITY_DN582_c0_g1_i2.p1 TRINITY_DN582_c0_g1~~TRINITY_DN582_c0_g1_i2.p1  ORF type:complete len:675 (-),score=160.07 TRINITY_DN582_c0_g1_i2:58-2082(-)